MTGSLLVLSTLYHEAIQGDSGGKVKILASDSIGHYEKIYTYKTIVNGNKKINYVVLI
jgi:hypothetical protein